MDVVVEFDYVAEETDELTIRKGNIIRDVSQFEDGWYIGNLNGKIGVFPDNFVKVLNSAETSNDPKPSGDEGGSAKNEENEESTVKPQGVKGIGLGNIFSGQPIQLKHAALKDVMKDAENNQEKKTPSGKQSPNSPELTDRVRVRFDYDPKQPDELELQVDDIIQVVDRCLPDDGWWKGRNLRTRKVGVFPDNFVAPISDTNKENAVESPTHNNASASVGIKPVGITTVSLHNGNPPNTGSSVRVSSVSSPSVTSGPMTALGVKSNEPPKLATKPVSTATIHNNTSGGRAHLNALGSSGTHRDTRISITHASGRSESKSNPSNPPDCQTNTEKSGERISKWKQTPDRSEQTERSISIVDERRSGEGTELSEANNNRLTGLTADRPRQTGRRLPSRFSRSTTPNSETSADLHNESQSAHKETHLSRSHNALTSRQTPTPLEDARSGADISERRAAELSARAQRTQSNHLRSGALPRSEGGSGSADLTRTPELATLQSVNSDAARLSLSKLQAHYDMLKTQHSQHLIECVQQTKEMRQQLEQLRESNKKLRSEMVNGQRALTERLQALMDEVDEAKKQRAADAVELARLRNILMQLDARSLLSTDQKYINASRQRQQQFQKRAGDRMDERLQETDDNDADSVYEEEDVPSLYKPMIGDSCGGLINKNGDTTSPPSHSVAINKNSTAPPLRPRPTHPASYSRG
ncbi:SH3-domain kinase binding protein 1 [Clonorchis sinensis]|uniref:SH3-domain kinase binding protein 1 n=2 Tax=Clonorchis sinensis TaxID=79923 RepID=A0A8T1M233_CLOSI|nr:SH3-domain kinase binding protein 1 [Clonorchis sinensis]